MESRLREFVLPFQHEGADVHHVTLDPGDGELMNRLTTRALISGSALDEEAIANAATMLAEVRSCYGPWTHVIDNSQLTPSETALAVHAAITSGEGLL